MGAGGGVPILLIIDLLRMFTFDLLWTRICKMEAEIKGQEMAEWYQY